MSRRRRQGLSPTLFPFLAVLVCTLGTLILFLALVAQNATEAAERESRAKQLEQAMVRAAEPKPATPRLTAEQVKAMISEEQFRAEQFLGIRESLTADIEDRRDQITYMEEQIKQVRQKLKQLNDKVENAMGMTGAQPIEQAAIDQLQAKVDATRATVEELRRRAKDKKPRIVIVPHKGPNGTDRRAIYLECTKQGITIWPEGSRITTDELEAAQSANPLDAALRVIRLHVMRHYGDSIPPYPLLVVRPDGVETYGAALKAMRDWDDQFGYELVPADIELAFSKPDIDLKQKVDLAIRSAASRQTQQHAVAQHRGFGGTGGRLPTLSAASLDRAGRASGFGSLRDAYSSNSLRSNPFPRNATPPRQPPSDGLYGSGSRPSNLGALDGMRGVGSNVDPTREAIDAMARDAQASSYADLGNGSGDTAGDGSSSQSGRSKRLTQTLNSYTTVPGSRLTNPEPTALAAGVERGVNQPSRPEASAYGSRRKTDSSAAGSNASGKTAQAKGPQPLRDPPSMAAASQQAGKGESKQPSKSKPAGKAGSPQQAGSGGSSSAPASGMSMPMGQSSSAAMNRSMSASQTANAPASTEMVRRQGSDWALPQQMAGAYGNAIVRTIRMRCYSDRFVMPSLSTRGDQVFSFADGNINAASLQLATALRDHIGRWGAALPGGRWQPRLEVEVMRGGETSFRQLGNLMSGSGIEVTQRGAP